MRTSLKIIEEAYSAGHNPVVAFSGGSDSTVLLDMVYRFTAHRPPVLFADSQMEYPETLPFIRETCQRYGAELLIAKASRTPEEQWKRQGWAMLGKLAARLWMQKHKHFDFKLDVSSCCRNMKIAPGRKLMKERGYDLQFTGTRGGSDDALRGLRALKDSATYYVKADKIFICNPLTGWTDTMIKRYIREYSLHQHPAKTRGAKTIGCMQCGGGAQFTNSGLRVLRQTDPAAWKKFMVDTKAGEVILAIKYDVPLAKIRPAIEACGGLETLATERPHVFDFLVHSPLEGYDK